MKFKIFIALFISCCLSFIPQNIIGCGGEIDPYDYYISFFNQYAASKIQYKPFYYTNSNFLYDMEEPESQAGEIIQEWVNFTKKKATAKDANDFVMRFARKDIANLYYHIEKNTALSVPDSVAKNEMTQFFLQEKNFEALGYILYAKQVEPYVVAVSDSWQPTQNDSLKMDKLIKNGLQLYNASKTPLFKLKYAYQITRLAHYSKNYNAAIKYYDELIAANNEKSILQNMTLALKAGALFRLGQHKEAAYLFSKAFAASDVQKISNYYGFNWSVIKAENRNDYLALCKNNIEKADMLSLFALQNPNSALEDLKEIYRLNPASELFSTLVVREINKYEELYLTPLIQSNEGDRGGFYYVYRDANADSVMKAENPKMKELMNFLNELSNKNIVEDKALMKVGAAYMAYMLQDYSKADEYIADAKKMNLSKILQDQLLLTNILVTINKAPEINAGFEEKLLPSLEWLSKKETKSEWADNSEEGQWNRFYRNLLVEVLAKRYHAQKDLKKELFCYSIADKINPHDYAQSGIDFLRSNFNGPQSEDLYNFLSAKKFTLYEKFLVNNSLIKTNDVADFAGTAYLRDYNYDKAITWLGKVKDNKVIKKNPFIDLLYDREERLGGDKSTTTKIAYAKEMKRLQELLNTDKANAAKYLYKLALGYYNVTYYGYAWQLVEYYRSGSDGYYIPEDATAFKKDYYGAFTAHDYFKKAMEAATDKEFRARCLFMMAKCAQKQISSPQYEDFKSDWDKYELAGKDYQKTFMNNKYFPEFKKQYATTKFYKEMLTRCSYLKDFVAGKYQ